MTPGDAETAATNSLDMQPGSNYHASTPTFDEGTSQATSMSSCNGAAGATDMGTVDISELIGELQLMLSEALERQQDNPCSPQLNSVGGTRWREVHSRLMSQAGAPSCPLERSSSQEVAELQTALQQSSSALKSSQQQLQLLSARVEELQTQLEADCESMMASVQEELQATHEAHQGELRELQELLQLQQAEAAEEASATAAREAALRDALGESQQAAQQAEAVAEAERCRCWEMQRRLEAYDNIWWKLQVELQLPNASSGPPGGADNTLVEKHMGTEAEAGMEALPIPFAHLTPDSLLAAARALQAHLREHSARGAAATDTASAAAAAAAANAATWRGRAELAEIDAARAGLAADELRYSLNAALAAMHEDAAALAATNMGLAADLERRQSQVAALTASGTELEARSARLGADVTSMAALQADLQVALMEAGGRHAALEAVISELREQLRSGAHMRDELAAQVSELREELRQARGRKGDLEGQVSELEGELLEARAGEEMRRLQQENSQRQRDEGARLAVEASDAAAELKAETAMQMEQLRLQIVDLYERLGQARARDLAEVARQEKALQAERAGGRAILAALRNEVAAAAAAAVCSRIFRATERAAAGVTAGDAAARLEEAQRLAARQTARAICARAAWRQDAYEAAATAAVHLAQQSAATATMRGLQARLVATEAAASELQAQLADSQRERDDLSARLVELRRQLEEREAVADGLTARLDEALAAGAAGRSREADTNTAMSELRSELAVAQEALQDLHAAALSAGEAAREQLSNTRRVVDGLQQQLEAAGTERQQLQEALAATEAAALKLQDLLANTHREWESLSTRLVELQGQLEQGEAAASGLAARLEAALAAGTSAASEAVAARGRADAADITIMELKVELATVQQALQDHQSAALTAREASLEELSSAQGELNELRQQIEAKGVERRQLQEALAAAALTVNELQTRAADSDASYAELQSQLNNVTVARDALQQLQQDRRAESDAEREQQAESLATADLALQSSKQECASLRGVVSELQIGCTQLDEEQQELRALLEQAQSELEMARSEAQRAQSELDHERSSHEATGARLQSQHAACDLLQAQLRQERAVVSASTAAAPLLSPRTHAKAGAAGQQQAAGAAPAGGAEHMKALPWSPGPLSHRVDVDAAAEAETEAGGCLGGAAGCSGDGTAAVPATAAVAGRGSAQPPSPGRCSADLPQYDQEQDRRLLQSSSNDLQAAACSIATRSQPDAGACGCDGSPSLANGCGLQQQEQQSLSPARVAGAEAGVDTEEPGQGPRLRQEVTALWELLEAERGAQAARIITLRALRAAERSELQRQLTAAAAAVAAAGSGSGGSTAALLLPPRPLLSPRARQGLFPAPSAGQFSVINVVWELPPTAALEPRSFALAAGSGGALAADGAAANRPQRRSLELPNARATGGPPLRAGLPPLPPHDAPHPPALERCPSRNSTCSNGSRGSSYWLPAAAAMAAAAADYDPNHEPLWVTNAAFGGGIPVGCMTGSSTAPSESPVADLAETIAALRAELAASQEALLKARGTAPGGAAAAPTADAESVRGALTCRDDISGGGSIDDNNTAGWCCRDEGGPSRASHPATPPLLHSAQYDAVTMTVAMDSVPSASYAAAAATADLQQGAVRSAADQGQENHGGKDCGAVAERLLDEERAAAAARQLVMRALRTVERSALQRELAEARAAHAAAATTAGDARSRLAALLASHTRVCGEVEMLRAAHDELAAEMGPARRLMERFRSQNEQLRVAACDAAVQHAANAADAVAAVDDARARIAACEAREAALTIRCDDLAARCEDLEAQLASAVASAAGRLPPASPRGVEAQRAAAEAGRVQLATQVLELRAEQAASVTALERLRVEYASARLDRQRLQQRLALMLTQTASVQTAAAELCGSLRAAHAELDEQKSKLDEQQSEVARVQAESTAARQQLARARADGRQRAVETRAWARQAVLLQEQLAQLVQGARSGLLPRGSAAGDGSPGGAADWTGPAAAAAGNIGGSPAQAGVARSPSPDASGMQTGAAPLGLLHGVGCAGGGAGMGRRCLSAIDLTSLTRGVEEDAHQHQPQQHQQPQGRDGGFLGPSGGLAALLLRGGDGGPFLPGLPAINVHHLALLQGRVAWNLSSLGLGAGGAHIRQLAGLRLRASVTTGGAPLAPAGTPAVTPPRNLGRADAGSPAAAAAAARAVGQVAADGTGAPSLAVETRPNVTFPAATAAAPTSGAGTCAAGAPAGQQLHRTLQQGQQHQDVWQSPTRLGGSGPTSPTRASASAPAPSGAALYSVKPYWQPQVAGGVTSPHSARTRSVFSGHLRRLAEEEGEGQEADSGPERQAGEHVGGAACLGKERGAELAGTEWDGEKEEEGGHDAGENDEDDDGASVGVEEGDAAGGFAQPMARAASAADMHLFYNPMYSAGKESRTGAGGGLWSLPAVPKSAREYAGVASTSPAAFLALARASAEPFVSQATPQEQQERPAAPGRACASGGVQLAAAAGNGGARARRLSADPSAVESASAQQLRRRLPVWPSFTAAAVVAGGPGPSVDADCTAAGDGGGGDGGEQLVPVSRSNPVAKLYRKISRRLSSTSRESREGGIERG